MGDDPVHVISGPSRHGVVIHAQRLRTAMGGLQVERCQPGDRAITHFTERIWAAEDQNPLAALRLATDAATHLTVVLHDLPDPNAGEGWSASRRQTYAAVAERAHRIVVASRWERNLLADALSAASPAAAASLMARCHVVGLPVARPPHTICSRPRPVDGAVVTMGFLYPGKGVEEVIAATQAVRAGLEVVNLGGSDAGHPGLETRLLGLAAAAGVRWSTTGWLDQRALHARMQAAAVPVVFHRHVSASGSINEWLAVGRRPLVRSSPYARELAERVPGAVVLVDGTDGLTDGIAAALADPSSTWLQPGQRLGHSWGEAGARMRALVGR